MHLMPLACPRKVAALTRNKKKFHSSMLRQPLSSLPTSRLTSSIRSIDVSAVIEGSK
jgi:hypothetical protein